MYLKQLTSVLALILAVDQLLLDGELVVKRLQALTR